MRVKDFILSIPVPRSLQVGDTTSTSTYYLGAARDALFFIVATSRIFPYVHIFNHFISFLSFFVKMCLISFHMF